MSMIFNKLFTCPQWFIAYRQRQPFAIPFTTDGFQAIKPPPGRFYADPFVIKNDNKNYIFFEEFCFIKGKGFISFVAINSDGSYTKPQRVLERKYHLSYPFLFKWNNKIYMIPESSENDTIELYAARSFPYDWTLEKVMLRDLKANDTTIWFSGQKAWMFTNIVGQGQQPYTELCLFHAESIFDEWQAHPRNPIISDITSARPAGNLFLHNGEIIRPGQNSLIRYGHALVFNKLTCLTEHDYSELKIEQVEPDWYPGSLSCHTYNFNEDLEVIDGEVINTEFLKPYRRLASHLYRFFAIKNFARR